MDMKENGKWGGEEGIMLQGLTVTESIVQCTVIGLWELAELTDGPTGCCEVARGGCAVAWNVRVTRSAVIREAERRNWTI